jgi:bisphosphoglycerate-dependent phosphoglycerate mutase
MKLILVRHGESEANFQNYWTGWLDVDLTEKGIEQAKKSWQKNKRCRPVHRCCVRVRIKTFDQNSKNDLAASRRKFCS